MAFRKWAIEEVRNYGCAQRFYRLYHMSLMGLLRVAHKMSFEIPIGSASSMSWTNRMVKFATTPSMDRFAIYHRNVFQPRLVYVFAS